MNRANLEQINELMTDIFHAFKSLPDEAKEFLLQELSESLRTRNNSSVYTLHTFKGIHHKALELGLTVHGSSILEIGPGKPLGTAIFWNYAGARKYTAIDKFTEVNQDDVWLRRFRSLLDHNIFNPFGIDIDTLIRQENETLKLDCKHIQLIQDDLATHDFESETFDFIYSNAVLEHMCDLEVMFRRLHEILAPGGLMFHSIDLREHLSDRPIADKNTSIEFYKFSREEWNHRYPPGWWQTARAIRMNGPTPRTNCSGPSTSRA